MKLLMYTMLAALVLFASNAYAETTFTYQGRLGAAGQPAEGPHDFVFRLFDAESNGAQVGADVAAAAVDVTDGIFTVQLDFGEAPFNSSPRWLEIDVRESGGGAYTTLAPRNRIGASPFAVETLFVAPGAVDTASIQDGAVTAAKIAPQAVTRSRIKPDAIGTEQIENGSVTSADIQNGAVTTTELADDAVTTNKIADGAVDTANLAPGAVGSSQIANQSIAAIDLAPGSVGTSEIIDGTITPADVSGGLYARKGDLYLREQSVLVGPNGGENGGTVSCDDGNELLVIAVCNPESTNNSLRLVQRQLTNLNQDVLPATLVCIMQNNGSTGQRFSATVGCVAVP